MTTLNQDSLAQDRVEWFEDMEHVLGHITSELDSLETSQASRLSSSS
jgi:hypothetical protein